MQVKAKIIDYEYYNLIGKFYKTHNVCPLASFSGFPRPGYDIPLKPSRIGPVYCHLYHKAIMSFQIMT